MPLFVHDAHTTGITDHREVALPALVPQREPKRSLHGISRGRPFRHISLESSHQAITARQDTKKRRRCQFVDGGSEADDSDSPDLIESVDFHSNVTKNSMKKDTCRFKLTSNRTHD